MLSPDDIVECIRTVAFVGRRGWMDKQLGQSLNDGVKIIQGKGLIITNTIIPPRSMEQIEAGFNEIMHPIEEKGDE